MRQKQKAENQYFSVQRYFFGLYTLIYLFTGCYIERVEIYVYIKAFLLITTTHKRVKYVQDYEFSKCPHNKNVRERQKMAM